MGASMGRGGSLNPRVDPLLQKGQWDWEAQTPPANPPDGQVHRTGLTAVGRQGLSHPCQPPNALPAVLREQLCLLPSCFRQPWLRNTPCHQESRAGGSQHSGGGGSLASLCTPVFGWLRTSFNILTNTLHGGIFLASGVMLWG